MTSDDRASSLGIAGETVATPPLGGEAGEARRAAEDGVASVWNPGDVILGLYEVKGVLGEGGMGTVYQVHHREWNTDLAVKSPKGEELAKAGGAENFVREAEAWVNLGLHPHVVSCYYVRTLGGIPRVFAEYVEGGSLAQWIRDRKLYEGGPQKAIERILDIAIQFAWGLDYAHEQGLIHQDVKPANVMMAPNGTVKVTDFGLARARGRAPAPGEAKPGGTLMAASGGMTLAYASPEQARGEALTRRTDIWSWGVSLLEMFTGEVTWLAGQAAAEALQGYLEVGAEDAELPKMPPPIAELLARCFVEDPQKRPQGMVEIAKQLQESYEQLTKCAYARPEPKAAELTADSLNNRALSLLDLGREKEAEEAWLAALQADPQHPDTTYNRGLMHWRGGKITDDQLVQQLEEVRKTHGDTWQTKYLLALVHVERADVDAARPLLEEAQREAPNEPAIQQSLELLNSDEIVPGKYLRTFEGHTDEVDSVCFSPDGRYALSGSFTTRDLRLWEVASGHCLRAFEGHTSRVISICFSPDGRYALSGDVNHTVWLWDLATGSSRPTFEGFADAVCFSPDGRYALSSSRVGTLRLWEVASGRSLRSFEGHQTLVRSVCFSPDGRYALSGSDDTKLRLWEVASGHCLRTFEGHTSRVLSVCFSPDGRYGLSGGWDKPLRLWELVSGRCLRTFQAHADWVFSVCFSPDGRYAISASRDKTLRLWEVASGHCLRTFEGHKGSVYSVCFSPDGRYALSGSSDKTLRLWQCQREAHDSPTQLSRMWSFSEASNADARMVELLQRAQSERAGGRWSAALEALREARALPGKARTPRLLDAWGSFSMMCHRSRPRAGWFERFFEGEKGTWASQTACFSPDGRYAISARADKTLLLWEVASGRCLRTLEGHTRRVSSVCLSPDGRYALSVSLDMRRLWEVASGRCLRTFEGKNLGHVRCISPDGRFVVSTADRILWIWEVASGRRLRALEGQPHGLSPACLSPDGRYALSGSSDKTFRLWEVASGRCLRTLELEGVSGSVTSVCFSPDGRHALSGAGMTLRLWEVASGHCLRTFEGHTGPVNSVCFSPDARFALSGSGDRTLRLWEVESGRCLHTLGEHSGAVDRVCFSADGQHALSKSAEGAFEVWHLDWELEARNPADWEDGARPYLETFLTLHMPYAGSLPGDREPQEDEIKQALTREGTPSWTEEDFKSLMDTLCYAGYGWLRPEGVRSKLQELARDWKEPPALSVTNPP